MSTSLQQRMLTSASAYAPLQALLGTPPGEVFRWYFDILEQGSAFPAVVVQQISGSKTYSATARLKTGYSRYQFTIWGGQFAAGSQARDDVAAALVSFMDQWAGGTGITGLSLYPNENVLDRKALYVQKDTPVYQRLMDFRIFSDDSI